MKWIGISGGWRRTNNEIERLVRDTVLNIMKRGDGIVSGGALGVDSIALDEALKHNTSAERIKIFLPTTLELYAAHYRSRAKEGVITIEQAESLITQLTQLEKINRAALIENKKNEIVDKSAYFERNSEVVNASDELIAFPIITETSEASGTNDTIQKAKAKGIPVKIFEFNLTQHSH